MPLPEKFLSRFQHRGDDYESVCISQGCSYVPGHAHIPQRIRKGSLSAALRPEAPCRSSAGTSQSCADVWRNEFRASASSASVDDFSFQIQAHDASGLTHAQAVTFHVMDFSIAAPDPSSVTLSPGGNTTVSVLVSSLGAFNEGSR